MKDVVDSLGLVCYGCVTTSTTTKGTTMTIADPIIESFSYGLQNRGIITPNMQPACVATLEFPNGDFLTVSRYDNEDKWVLDSHFKSNGYPVFSNGTGSRCTRTSSIKADAPIVAVLDEKRDLAMSGAKD